MSSLAKIALLSVILNSASLALDNPESAFDALKALQGNWAIQSEGKTLPIQMSYAIGSKGSIVTEQFGKELSVFYRNGSDVEMIHFCNAGNQPRLKLKENSRAGQLVFETFDVTNLPGKDAAHVDKIIYSSIDSNRIDLEIVWREGQSQKSEKYILRRAGV